MNGPNHTPGPWSLDYDPEMSPNIWIVAPTNSGVAKVEICEHREGRPEELNDEDWANAAFIVRACNSHDALLSACRALLATWGSDDEDAIIAARRSARAAIAKATGGRP